MKTCCFCQKEVTEKQIEKNEGYELVGVWSHKECDEKQLEKIDRHIKVIKHNELI